MDDEKVPEYLYHYTTAEGLKGIVEDCAIWASDIFSLNDASEIYHGCEVFRECLKELHSTLGEDFHGRVLSQVNAIDALAFPPTYVCSFSREPNDLSQWRAYFPNGGYAISFASDRAFPDLDHQ